MLADLSRDWDLLIIGGGITGAGVFRRATALGLRCLLVEQQDFAWGTSSRSAKLVHGGLRYIAQGHLRTSYHSVREREQLLAEMPGLVHLIDFAFPVPRGGWVGVGLVKMALSIWDRMAGRMNHRYLNAEAMRATVPRLETFGRAGFVYGDGATDDARLVLRVLQSGTDQGGTALNYTRVQDLLRSAEGRVVGARLQDADTGETAEVFADAVVNATGAWVDDLRAPLGHAPLVRRLRGSHLFLSQDRLPVPCAVTIPSVSDSRTLYVVPWEGVTLVGTTDLDHAGDLSREPYMAPDEGAYILAALQRAFPSAELTEADVLCTQAGVRPVIGTGKADPSKESRDAQVLSDDHMVSVSGGKLTTFDFMARRTLAAAAKWLTSPGTTPTRPALPSGADAPPERFVGRYGWRAQEILQGSGTLDFVGDTRFTWSELRWSAGAEQVRHLDDLLLRRTRLGMLLPDGAAAHLDRLKAEVQPVLGWSDARWASEVARYRALWHRAYGPERMRSAPVEGRLEPPAAVSEAV